MALDLILLAILLSMVALGAWRGAVASLVGLMALIAGYAGAVGSAARLSELTASTLVVPVWLAPAVAGSFGFAFCWLATHALGDVALAWDAHRIEGGGRGPADRLVGGLLGSLRGGLIVVLLAVLASWLDAARDVGAVDGLAGVPEAEESAAVAASGELVGRVVATALADVGPAGQVAARVVARPAETLGNVQSLLEDPRLAQLFEDRLLWTLITNGSVDYAMNRASIRAVVDDEPMRARFASLGLVDPAAVEDRDAFRAALAEVLAELAPKVHRLQHDPELLALAEDPEIVALVESGDMMALIAHPAIRSLVGRVAAR